MSTVLLGRCELMSTFKDFRLSLDTSDASERLFFERMRTKSTEEKLRMVSKMTAATRALAMSGLKERYPAESAQQLRMRLAELLYGADIARELSKRESRVD